MEIKKFAAIDIGSNAMRLLISNVLIKENEVSFNKSHLVRVPIRLGQDVFTKGKISDYNIMRMRKAMQAFMLIMEIYEVQKFAACATSAIRNAVNGEWLADVIRKESQINIQTIDGEKEAKIIANSGLSQYLKRESVYLYVDVGGGSTEFSIFVNGEITASKSFKMGTVRLLNNNVSDDIWLEAKDWINKQTSFYTNVQVIGSGGNINKIMKLSGKSNKKPLTLGYLLEQYDYLNKMSYEDRISILQLNTDRADVIVHALGIYIKVMKWSNAQEILIPKIGLTDGIIKEIYYKNHIIDYTVLSKK